MRCPMCKTEIDPKHLPETRPFCSPRCKKLDLANWLDEKYRLPRELNPDELADLTQEQQEQVLAVLFEQIPKGSFH